VLRPDLSLRFTPKAQYDGKRILAARGKEAFLWDAETGKLIQRFTGSTEEVQAVTFCPVGPYTPPKGEILTGAGKRGGILGDSKDNAIRLWNVEDGVVKRFFGPLMGPVMALKWAPDKSRFVNTGRFISSSVESSGADAFRQRLWEDFGATELFMFEGYDPQFSPDGAMVVCRNYEYGGVTSFVGVWDVRTYLQLCTLPGEGKTFYSAKFSPYGNRLVTTATGPSNTPVVEVWEAETGKHLLDLKGARAFDAAYTHDGKRIVTANPTNGPAVWNAETGELGRTLECPMRVHAMLLSPDGQRCLATWGPGRSFGNVEGASLWDVQTGKELLRSAGHAEGLVGFAADGATIFGFDEANENSGTVWSAETGKVVRTIRLE
jgi:WD40 repeat protein